ncbi:hypothetical protein QNI19_02775 [Cytophagaceae bacterium DM2B3-1]|uniref:Uncharacterized protein n=2 Tax=Xanthocytophaga TaxID=3078918 RepID=A0AAE3QRP8_9BACT|nr:MULTISPECIES: hypothetical protein [Xanthocytophaga]MDJ1472659.1 hypothetical protein [Xanthocytophaga flavus]MDJ1482285.1 hypothetical protein [Xanthocytophaga flavus]MDJ1491839.1 hypothetical protein [Xanthocytophaga flavus]MDJ1502765.1 hypothetical protein [Xanthocytophaga agilis]
MVFLLSLAIYLAGIAPAYYIMKLSDNLTGEEDTPQNRLSYALGSWVIFIPCAAKLILAWLFLAIYRFIEWIRK